MRFIHVGVGGFGRTWVKNLAGDERCQVVALVDVNERSLADACTAGGYSRDICHPTLEDALGTVEADAVMCSTPPAYHRHDVVTALEAGLHALSEKPMSDNLADCRAMLDAARRTGKTYVVSQQYRYSAAMWALAETVRSGELGAIGQIKMDFYMGVDFGGGFRHDMPYPLIIDMSIHHFDLLRAITGLNAVTVRASAWNPPWSNYRGDCSSTALFTMDNGARAVYNASWCAKGQFNDWNCNWQIECEHGTVVYQNGAIEVLACPDRYKVETRRNVAPVEPSPAGQLWVLNDFLQAAAGGERARTDVSDNIRSVAMVFATVAAIESGGEEPVLPADLAAQL